MISNAYPTAASVSSALSEGIVIVAMFKIQEALRTMSRSVFRTWLRCCNDRLLVLERSATGAGYRGSGGYVAMPRYTDSKHICDVIYDGQESLFGQSANLMCFMGFQRVS